MALDSISNTEASPVRVSTSRVRSVGSARTTRTRRDWQLRLTHKRVATQVEDKLG